MKNDEYITVSIADFTVVPGARHIEDGDGSAEEFFNDYLKPAIENKSSSKFLIDFDNTWGYASSFISELAKDIKVAYGSDFIKNQLLFKSDEDLMLIDRFKNELAKEYN